jgi:hypothetical protein
MNKFLFLVVFVLPAVVVFPQDSPNPENKKRPPVDMTNRPNDHFMIQFGYADWAGIPDSINKKGFSKSFNVYFLFDFPFKTNPNLSIAVGPGISTDHILFANTRVGIKDRSAAISFANVSDTDHYKKTKLATAYLEAPVELRYSANPQNGKGFKAAVGIKVGTLLNAHTRNTKYENKSGSGLGEHVLKESSKNFFNRNRLCLTARAGYGHFSLFGSYQVTTLFKDGEGPVVRPFTIGITLSGL